MTGRRGTRCCRSTSASSSRSERRPLYFPLIDVWAVGSYHQPNGPDLALTLRWDGSRWSKVATPGVVVAVGSPVSFTVSTGKQPNGRPCVVTN
jgi:hypothetical protein